MGAGRVALHAAVALVAVCAAFVIEVVLHAPSPEAGDPITQEHYTVDTSTFSSSNKYECSTILAETFFQSTLDEPLNIFLNESAMATSTAFGRLLAYAKRHAFWSLQRYLGWARTDASGFLRLADLYVASENQLRELLKSSIINDKTQDKFLLDVGSGRGTETIKLAAALGIHNPKNVHCLESSSAMRSILGKRGFVTAGSISQFTLGSRQFSSVSLLNVLDRCDDPISLLDLAVNALEPGGALVIGIVLPFYGKVYEGKVGSKWGRANWRLPRSRLNVNIESSFELGLASFVDKILNLQPQLKMKKWTRVPYVSSGDTRRTFYTIDMALMIFEMPLQHNDVATGDTAVRRESVNEANVAKPRDELEKTIAFEEELPQQCRGYKVDKIYSWLAKTVRNDGLQEWGQVLDAGAGYSSMCWLMRQRYDSLTGVTAVDDGTYGAKGLRDATAKLQRVEIAVGNWRDTNFMHMRQYDIVVADYLIGATEQHWKYGAGALFNRILKSIRPGGYLLFVGLEPYEIVLNRKQGTRDRLVLDIETIGDTAAALAGESTYRELPEEWVRDEIARSNDFTIIDSKQFQMRLTLTSMQKQLSYARMVTSGIDDPSLQAAYKKRIKSLEDQLRKSWHINEVHTRARNYAIVARRRERAIL